MPSIDASDYNVNPYKTFVNGGESWSGNTGEKLIARITIPNHIRANGESSAEYDLIAGDDSEHAAVTTVPIITAGGETFHFENLSGNPGTVMITGYEVSGLVDNTVVEHVIEDYESDVTVPTGETWTGHITHGKTCTPSLNGADLTGTSRAKAESIPVTLEEGTDLGAGSGTIGFWGWKV